MALHRDIFWVGRQWAVTGYGIQAVDQKHKGQFDVEVGRLWEDGLADGLQADGWLNREDFGKALAVARARYPAPPRIAPPPEPPSDAADLIASAPIAPAKPPLRPVEPPKAAAPSFDMRIVGWPAKFVQPWHVRIRR